MDTLLTSASFWTLVLTTLAFFVSYCYLSALYSSFNIPWGNVAVSDVLIKGIPALGVLITILIYLSAEPAFPWHRYVGAIVLGSNDFARLLLPAVAVSAVFAVIFGKLQAWRLRSGRRCVDVETTLEIWRSVVVVAFAKDVMAVFDPATRASVLIPWSGVKSIRPKEPRPRAGLLSKLRAWGSKYK